MNKLSIPLCISGPHKTAIAVSGGADSMALALMAAERGEVVALTVDHGLRAESADEARQVCEWMQERGIPHHVLKWERASSSLRAEGEAIQPNHTKANWIAASATPPRNDKSGNLQSIARDARYHLMTEWCKAHDINTLLTAHHKDDQAETILFRILRGTGIDGMVGILPETEINGVKILRPLLHMRKYELIAYLEQQNQAWVEDPSNALDVFDRNALRKQLQALPDYDAVVERFTAIVEPATKVRKTLEAATEQLLQSAVQWLNANEAILNLAIFNRAHNELATRALSQLITRLNGEYYPPRYEQLERCLQQIKDPAFKNYELGNCRFARIKGEIGKIRVSPIRHAELVSAST